MKFLKENYLFILLIIFLFIIDRFSKTKILSILKNQDFIFINDYLNLNLIFNTGIGFGLLSLNAGIYYNLLSILIFIIIIVLFYFMIKSKLYDKIFFSLIIGGAIEIYMIE